MNLNSYRSLSQNLQNFKLNDKGTKCSLQLALLTIIYVLMWQHLGYLFKKNRAYHNSNWTKIDFRAPIFYDLNQKVEICQAVVLRQRARYKPILLCITQQTKHLSDNKVKMRLIFQGFPNSQRLEEDMREQTYVSAH